MLEKFKKEKGTPKQAVMEALPPFLQRRFIILMVTGIGIALITFPVIIFMSGGLFESLGVLLGFGSLAAAIIVIAVIFRRSVLYNGYTTIEGVITFVKYGTMPSKRRKAVQFHIRTEDGQVYGIPVFSGNPEASKGTRLRVYTSKNHSVNETSGLKFIEPFWGYEIAGGEDDDINDIDEFYDEV